MTNTKNDAVNEVLYRLNVRSEIEQELIKNAFDEILNSSETKRKLERHL
ncbi:MAG: hypothetical protein ACP5N2_03645 [Candidatus Nanoarchaeia archaeon]